MLFVVDLELVADREVIEATDVLVLGIACDAVVDAVNGERVVADRLDDALCFFLVAKSVLQEVTSRQAREEQEERENPDERNR